MATSEPRCSFPSLLLCRAFAQCRILTPSNGFAGAPVELDLRRRHSRPFEERNVIMLRFLHLERVLRCCQVTIA